MAKGNAEAAYQLARFGLAEETPEALLKRRLSMLQTAAELGQMHATYELAMHHESGEGVDINLAEANRLLCKAADLGHPHAIWRLGVMHVYGTGGMPRNVGLGKSLIERAAAARSQGALRTLAGFYKSGEFGYRLDLGESRRLFDEAERENVIPI